MTTNMREIAEKAYDAGYDAAAQRFTKRDAVIKELVAMDNVIRPYSISEVRQHLAVAPEPLAPKKRRGRVAKAADAPKAPKAPVIARGVKRASTGPRTKGVKEAIVNLIGQHSGIAVTDIVSKLGFKETSVRATLMGLKKSNIAAQDDEKNWYLTANAIPASNSEHQSAEPEMY